MSEELVQFTAADMADQAAKGFREGVKELKRVTVERDVALAELELMREALEEIVSPIKFMQARLEDGCRLNGMAAIQMANDSEYLRQIAKQALSDHSADKLEMVEPEPVSVEAVAVTRKSKDGDLYLDWLVEGGIDALEFSGVTLLVAHGEVTNDEGYGEVYRAQQAEVKP